MQPEKKQQRYNVINRVRLVDKGNAYLAYAFSNRAGQNGDIPWECIKTRRLLTTGRRSSMRTSVHSPHHQIRNLIRKFRRKLIGLDWFMWAELLPKYPRVSAFLVKTLVGGDDAIQESFCRLKALEASGKPSITFWREKDNVIITNHNDTCPNFDVVFSVLHVGMGCDIWLFVNI